jgi:flagellar basal-body rod protein FlgG
MVMRSLEIAATGMAAQQTNVDVLSNNIANMTTTGFKRQQIEFKDLMYQDIARPGATSSENDTKLPSGMQLGSGVATGSIYRVNEQGTLQQDNNPLDLAVNGNGYFQIQMPDGSTSYTRDGVFSLNAGGQIVNGQGYQLYPAITLPKTATSISISTSGQVAATIPGQTTQQAVGQIQIATFVNPVGLEALGNNNFAETEASGAPTVGNPNQEQFGTITQGALENSNVDVVQEMTQMITAQRAYEMNSNVISTSNQMLQTVSQIK